MALTSIELQVISKILTSDDENVVDTLCSYNSSYYSIFSKHIEFILDHRNKNGNVPDVFTFQATFPDITLVQVNESLEYLTSELKKNKELIILRSTFNKMKDLGSEDVSEAWEYIRHQLDEVDKLDTTDPLDVVHDARKRSQQVADFSKQSRIPTGFDEIDKVMYGGLSTVEELLVIVARTNTGKSWVGTKMMESAQRNGFPVLYYSPEMQASFLGTRFDTWRAHFKNSQLHQGKYDKTYLEYISDLEEQETSAFILEDKDVASGEVSVDVVRNIVKRHGIKLVIIDGLSYMHDTRSMRGAKEYETYKHLCADLFRMSKEFGCAVVVMMQANRDTKDLKDDKGQIFPNAFSVEGSDHPVRIATQVFAMRQIFDKHILDIRLEKSRNANNQKPEFSYSWDIDTGNMQYIPGDSENEVANTSIAPSVSAASVLHINNVHKEEDDLSALIEDDDECEF